MKIPVKINNLTKDDKKSEIQQLLDFTQISDRELELVIGGTGNLTTSTNMENIMGPNDPGATSAAWNPSSGGGSGGSGGGNPGGSGGW
ncbi:hypothetical protein H6G41_17545 [Tolypothrix sp. FACHB-123]|uniref:hypothetical protein n=1 Tax=Tolypothrix sp. FACHB-123 TaxID=2692868 RepID=UPI00168442FF|nr:hypothetical protein [Tolypothrix sp. FACHB-123]MBD2356407.1 hypothetical protein [Tolypothrix sp. FACHB-123]